MVDIYIDYNEAKMMVDKKGWNHFVRHFEKIKKNGFYSCSKDWYDDPKYICKIKGDRGDLIVGWK
ncbi:hypothetical protein D3C81_753370 [compost metagenome]